MFLDTVKPEYKGILIAILSLSNLNNPQNLAKDSNNAPKF